MKGETFLDLKIKTQDIKIIVAPQVMNLYSQELRYER